MSQMLMSQRHDAPGERADHDDLVLPHEVQEHLGRKLRATLAVEAEKPAFLGDSAIPARFESYIRKLEDSERPAQKGLEAVRRALGVEDEPPGQPAWQDGQKKVERPD